MPSRAANASCSLFSCNAWLEVWEMFLGTAVAAAQEAKWHEDGLGG